MQARLSATKMAAGAKSIQMIFHAVSTFQGVNAYTPTNRILNKLEG